VRNSVRALAAFSFLVITVLQGGSSALGETIPISNFLACNSATEMNCIVSLSATLANGTKVSAIRTGKSNSWDSKDFQQNIRTYVAEEWRVPGLVNSSGTDTLATQIWMPKPITSVNGIDYGALDITLFASLLDSPLEILNSPLCSNPDLLTPCNFPAQFPNNVTFELIINSNLLNPGVTSGSVSDVQYQQLPISGGYQYIISGKPMRIPVNLPDKHGTNPGDFPQALDDRNYWHLYTLDSRSTSFGWKNGSSCNSGNPIISSNAATAGLPSFNASTKEVTLQVASPHMSSDGVTAESGIFQAVIPLSGVACLWGVAADSLSAKAQISIEYQDGTASTASLTTLIKGNNFLVNANGYHYSNPTVHFKMTSSTPITVATPSASPKPNPLKTTITCLKGKLVKKVTAVNPSCPAGYKKK
jgi:hypothetical protein